MSSGMILRCAEYGTVLKKDITVSLPLMHQEIEEVQRCRECRKKLKSVKTRERKIRTLPRETHLQFALKRCRCHGTDNRQILKAIVPEDSNFDMKMVISIGILQCIMGYQRSEMRTLIESHRVHISTGEISNMSREFFLRFYCIHENT